MASYQFISVSDKAMNPGGSFWLDVAPALSTAGKNKNRQKARTSARGQMGFIK